MAENTKDELMDTFDKMFAVAQQDLRGTEQEILIFKSTARYWFESGVREAATIFHQKGRRALDEARSEVDKHFAFMNNHR